MEIGEENAQTSELPEYKQNDIETEIHEEKAQTSELPEYKNNDIETEINAKKVAQMQHGIGKQNRSMGLI
jgi:hypothetical protein